MLTCWLHRWIISERIDANRGLPATLQRHLQSCPVCREFYQATIEISEQLIDEAGGERKAPSPFLHGNIAASLKSRHSRPVQGILRPFWAASATLVIILISLTFTRNRQNSESQVSLGTSNGQTVLGMADFFSVASKLTMEDKLREWSQRLDEPL